MESTQFLFLFLGDTDFYFDDLLSLPVGGSIDPFFTCDF